MKIAIIDDTPINLMLMRRMLSQVDHDEAQLFESPTQGLQWCLENEPDLIVVDYMMPELDGLGFIEQVRACEPLQEIPLVMVTANTDTAVRHRALDLGATDFLCKPIDTHEFLARTRNMLSIRRGQKAMAERASWLASEVARATASILLREQETIVRLSRAAEFKDPETGAHLQRMARYSALIARELGWSPADQQLLQQAAPMHDIGKVGIPDAILLKPGKLDGDEWAIMRQHPELGHRILSGSDSPLLQLGAELALAHHEKYDGSGYPSGLAGNAIPMSGRIVAVADVFDALMSARPYKEPWTLEQAYGYMRENSGQHFDPACVAALLRVGPEIEAIRARFVDDSPETTSPCH